MAPVFGTSEILSGTPLGADKAPLPFAVDEAVWAVLASMQTFG